MLRGNARGIVLTTGVPKVGGGIRPPNNGTCMPPPVYRALEPGEVYLVEHNATATPNVPNRTTVKIRAE
jgi:hypothetical protein